MNSTEREDPSREFEEIRYPDSNAPVLLMRKNGGFLAVSPPNATLRIGVAARTESGAKKLFEAEIQKWAYDLEGREALGS